MLSRMFFIICLTRFYHQAYNSNHHKKEGSHEGENLVRRSLGETVRRAIRFLQTRNAEKDVLGRHPCGACPVGADRLSHIFGFKVKEGEEE